MLILIVPKTRCLTKKRQRRERRTAKARATSITRQIKEVINVRLKSLLLTPMHKAEINGARADNPLGRAGQVPPLSNY